MNLQLSRVGMYIYLSIQGFGFARLSPFVASRNEYSEARSEGWGRRFGSPTVGMRRLNLEANNGDLGAARAGCQACGSQFESGGSRVSVFFVCKHHQQGTTQRRRMEGLVRVDILVRCLSTGAKTGSRPGLDSLLG
jgi:hypothetical protein